MTNNKRGRLTRLSLQGETRNAEQIYREASPNRSPLNYAAERQQDIEAWRLNERRNRELLISRNDPRSPEGAYIFPGRFVAKAAWEGMREPESQRISWTQPRM
jgi:hypothetical protein